MVNIPVVNFTLSVSVMLWVFSFRYGHFSGINRKVQMKFQPTGAPKKSSDDDGGYMFSTGHGGRWRCDWSCIYISCVLVCGLWNGIMCFSHDWLVNTILQESLGAATHFLCLAGKVLANERRCFICNIFSHWLRPCPAINQIKSL